VASHPELSPVVTAAAGRHGYRAVVLVGDAGRGIRDHAAGGDAVPTLRGVVAEPVVSRVFPVVVSQACKWSNYLA